MMLLSVQVDWSLSAMIHLRLRIQIAENATLLIPSNSQLATRILRLKGNMEVKSNGTFQVGDSEDNPVPPDRVVRVQLNYSASLAAGKYGNYSANSVDRTWQVAVVWDDQGQFR
jgi:hypothetical protein